jgi:hypothetical protein
MLALVLTFVWGAAMTAVEALGGNAGVLFPVEHAHLAFVGWLVNTVIGFALWLLPLNRERFSQTQGRYHPWTVWSVYGLLNAGLVARLISEPLAPAFDAARIVLMCSGVMQLAAVALLVSIVWYRTKPPSRPAPGVR